MNAPRIGVVVPCYRVADRILDVLARIPECVERIYVVDDACPEGSGDRVVQRCADPRVVVLRNPENLGVGGAVVHGYRQALADGLDIAVKIDGDGQMDPAALRRFVRPIIEERADYTKGNRFFSPSMLDSMPAVRLLGNAGLSFISKAVSGYWSIMDPTNGYTAISVRVLGHLPLDKLEKRYFFESDMLFRLGLLRAVVTDIPMQSRYAGERSSLSVFRTLTSFPPKYAIRFLKRFFYNYLLRDFNAGSLQTILGALLVSGGGIFGVRAWSSSLLHGSVATSGTVMLAALPIILGVQLLIAAQQWDMQNQPKTPIHPLL